jgi:hypothetical protein
MSQEDTSSTSPEILHEEYIPIEVVPPPDPLPPGDGFTFGVIVEPGPPPPPGTPVADSADTILDVDVFLVGIDAKGPTMTLLDQTGIKTYFQYLDRKLKFTNATPKDGIGRTADDAPSASLVLVVSNRSLSVASAGVVNIIG